MNEGIDTILRGCSGFWREALTTHFYQKAAADDDDDDGGGRR